MVGARADSTFRRERIGAMRSLRIAIFFCIAILGLSGRCHAETAEEMLSACRPITQAKASNGTINLPTDFESGACWGAFGMLHSAFMLVEPDGHPTLHACVPSNATRTELIAIFVRHIEQHPEDYGKNFQVVALNSILDTYPCNKKK